MSDCLRRWWLNKSVRLGSPAELLGRFEGSDALPLNTHMSRSSRSLHVSFIVDRGDQFPFQADVLLNSLQRNTPITIDSVVAQFVEGAHPGYRAELDDRGVRTTTVTRFLDGIWSNKLQQLQHFVGRGVDVMLVDTDVFFASDPTPQIPDRDVLSGKPVDHPNPPIETLHTIWDAAGLEPPQPVSSDADAKGGRTFPGNVNGGWYYVPAALVDAMDRQWRGWGEWLYAHRDDLMPAEQHVFVEQVSFCLAVHSGQHPFRPSPTNVNYPLILPDVPRLYDPEQPISMVHHHGLQHLARLLPVRHTQPGLQALTERIDLAIAEVDSTQRARHNARFHGSIDSSMTVGADLTNWLATSPGVPRLILHAGTPKTGTTSIQVACRSHHDELLEHGVDYPLDFDPPFTDRHQWLVEHLLVDAFDALEQRLLSVLAHAQAPTLLLSSEGITNHWADFSPQAKGWLAALARLLPMSVLIYLRDPAAYIVSGRRQWVRNGPHPRFPYGSALPLNDVVGHPWFSNHLDYLGMVHSMRSVFGHDAVIVAAYRRDVLPDFLRRIGVPDDAISTPGDLRMNPSASDLGIFLARQVLRSPLPVQMRSKWSTRLISWGTRISARTGWSGPPDRLSDYWQTLLDAEARRAEQAFGISFTDRCESGSSDPQPRAAGVSEGSSHPA